MRAASPSTRLPPSGPRAAGALRLVAALPDRLPVALLCLCVAAAGASVLAQVRPAVVLPAALALVLVTWRATPGPPGHPAQGAAGALIAIAIAAVWVGVNAPVASQYLTVTRDPGFLTLGGAWLTEHPDPAIPVPDPALTLAAAYDDVTTTPLAYTDVGGELVTQGATLVPALLAVAGWVGGHGGALTANLVIGGVGLVAVYASARRVAGPWWALVAPVALGSGMPMTVFSRAAYTEPVVLALVMGGLCVALGAVAGRRAAPYVLAGAMVGAASLARIDGPAFLVGLVLGIGLPAAAAVLPSRRRALLRGALLAVAGAGPVTFLGWWDLRVHSPDYLASLGHELGLLLAGAAAVCLAVVVLALPRPWGRARRGLLRNARTAGAVVACLVVAAGAVLATRPWWQTEHNLSDDGGYAVAVAALQARDGVPVDGTRSYDEWSLHWIAWYQGWIFVVLGIAGLALAAWSALRRRSTVAWVLLATVAAPSSLYLWRISITPDQIWAMRRLLPVTLPGFAVASALALSSLWSVRRWWRRAAAIAAAVTLVAAPLRTWGTMFPVVEQGGRLAEAQAVCDALPSDHVVYVRAGGPPYLATLLSFCGVSAVEMALPPSPERLAEIRGRWGDELAVVAFAPEALPWRGQAAPPPLLRSRITWWQLELGRLPHATASELSSVWVAGVLPDGRLVNVRP